MASAIQLTPMRTLSEISDNDTSFWLYQTNVDPWDPNEIPQWAPYPNDISSNIEQAHQCGRDIVYISEMYCVDLKNLVQQNIHNLDRQRPVCRRNAENNEESANKSRPHERASFPYGLATACSTIHDTPYHGLPFITDWLLIFTKGKLNVTFHSIFPALIRGLEQEGRNERAPNTDQILKTLNDIRDENINKRESIKMENLQACCATLYTKACFIYRVVNTALRDNDRTKLYTIGPYCYLLYNYVGRRYNDWFSIPRHFREFFCPTESPSMIVYRGDHIRVETINEYKEAVGIPNIYFKWLTFVSTSNDRDVAETFGRNTLYIIEIKRYSSRDQFAVLKNNTCNENEEEVLLKPGLRFQVERVRFDRDIGRYLIYLNVIPSYIHSII